MGEVNSRCALVCVLAIRLLVAGCSSDTGSLAPTMTPVPARATTPAAEPATAGAPAVPPAGKALSSNSRRNMELFKKLVRSVIGLP